MLEQIIEENVPRNTTYMMNTPQNKKAIMDDAYSDARSKALNAASSFGKGKMISESEKMIMAKNKMQDVPVSRLRQIKETIVKVPVKKSIKAMKKPM